MVDLGVPQEYLQSELEKLKVKHEFNLRLEPSNKQGIHGTKATVETQEGTAHRHLSDITKIIEESNFSQAVETQSLAIFKSIAIAEGKIHSKPPEAIHFHEIGAIDSIADIVGAAICLDYFSIEKILCTPIEVGSGYVDCEHGRFPVPAPATQELLKDAPCRYGGVTGESTTPTGTAILSTCVDEFEPKGIFTPQNIGYGIGHKDFELPNVLRVAIGHYRQKDSRSEEHVKIEANIDDMNPEAFDPLLKILFDSGAYDAYLNPILMKKNRPAQCLVVLCEASKTERITSTILNHSSTIGLRILPFEKIVLPREEMSIETSWGLVRIKRVTQPNGQKRWKSEHDDIVSIASNTDASYQTVKQKVDLEISQKLEERPTN